VTLRDVILEDLRTNRGQPKSQAVLVFFRLAQAARGGPLPGRARMLGAPVGILYRLLVEWLLGVELPWGTRVGRRLRIEHGVGLVVNAYTDIGDDVVLRQNVTIGNTGTRLECPRIEDGVDVGAGAVIIGDIVVGAGARIGANAVVVKDVTQGAVAVGVPAVERRSAR
jgi:serine O-acetyltransferase/putative colanic acid biosynthesis acetyltransferase WcaB